MSQGSRTFEDRCVLELTKSIGRKLPIFVLAPFPGMGRYLEAMHLGAVDYLEVSVSSGEMRRVPEAHQSAVGSVRLKQAAMKCFR